MLLPNNYERHLFCTLCFVFVVMMVKVDRVEVVRFLGRVWHCCDDKTEVI